MPPIVLFAVLGALAYFVFNASSSSPQTAGDGSPGPSPNDTGNEGNAASSALAQATAEGQTGGAGSTGSDGTGYTGSTDTTAGVQAAISPNAAFQKDYQASPWHDLIAQTESDCGIPQELLARIIYQESRFNEHIHDNHNPNNTVDRGICQINSIHDSEISPAEAADPSAAIPWAGQFLASLYGSQGTWYQAVRAYNGTGPAADAYAAAIIADVPSAA